MFPLPLFWSLFLKKSIALTSGLVALKVSAFAFIRKG